MASISSLGIGSGLDLNSLLNQLGEAERSKLEPIQQRIESQEVKISAYGEIQGALSGFQDAVATLGDEALFQSVSTEVSGDAVEAAASAEASPGRYEVSVDSLASAGSLATQRVDELDTVLSESDTSLNLGFEDGGLDSAVDIAAGSTLEDVRDAVNADPEAAVTASIVNDGEGYRLALMSEKTGEQAAITDSDFATMAADATLSDTTITQDGQDASLEVNGIAITSTQNQIDDAIQGVTLELQQAGDSTVTVVRDNEVIKEAVSGFVETYNTLKETSGRLTAFNGEGSEAGELLGDSTVRAIESRLRGDLGSSVTDGGDFSMLADVGLSLDLDGSLSLDEAQLDAALGESPEAVGAFFTGEDGEVGLAGRLGTTADQLLADDGALEGAIQGAEGQVERLGERYQRTEQGIEQTIERYRTQFGQLDNMIAQMNQTSAYLSQQLSGMRGQAEGGLI